MDQTENNMLPDYRRQLTRVVIREVLRRTISRQPVDTGRFRAARPIASTQLADVKQNLRNFVPNL